jgi:hypothetical protein
MTTSSLFQIANTFALLGWIVLVIAVVTGKEWLRDRVAGFWWPVALCGLYAILIGVYLRSSEGGFDSLENVRKLFTTDGALLAGWVHYLAFDLFIGSWIAREIMTRGFHRLWLLPLLPASFLLGPVGLLGFAILKCLSPRTSPP